MDEQAAALGIFQAIAHPRIEGFRSVAMPFLMNGERPPLRRVPPARGEHNAELLGELDYGEEEIARLLGSGGPMGGGGSAESRTMEETTWTR